MPDEFKPLFAWVDEDPRRNYIACSVAYAKDRANSDPSTAFGIADYAACGEGFLRLRDNELTGTFRMTFSDRIGSRSNDGGQSTGDQDLWEIDLRRDGSIDVTLLSWSRRPFSLEQVTPFTRPGGQFAVGFLVESNGTGLVAISFDRVRPPVIR